MGEVSFRQSLVNYAKDGVIDKQELKALNDKSKAVNDTDTGSVDAQIATQVMENLNSYEETTSIKFTLPTGESDATVDLEFDLTPNYGESEKVEGSTIDEALAKISQGDTLKSTKSDDYRCMCATAFNAAMRNTARANPDKSPSEVFQMVAAKVGVQGDFTYENVHKVQDKLYKAASKDKDPLISGGYAASVDGNGKVTSASVDRNTEMATVLNKLGMKAIPMIGSTGDSINDNKEAVDNYLKAHPNASFMVHVNIDVNTGEISEVDSLSESNHAVEVFQKDGKLYMKDTGAASNGKDNVIEVSRDYLYKAAGMIYALENK